MLECVVNISEGQSHGLIERIGKTVQNDLLDIHSDPDHNRSVVTLVGEESTRRLTKACVDTLDMRQHRGAHPRFGVVDVVPFVPLDPTTFDEAVAARDRFAAWASSELGVPCFLYGPDRTLPEVRRHAFKELLPDAGPNKPHPTAGAIAVGAREVLVAYNLWLREPDLAFAKKLAQELRGPHVRALGLQVGEHVQVSMNLTDPLAVRPDQVFDMVAKETDISRAELVGLIPRALLNEIPERRWRQLDLSDEVTIEARLALLNHTNRWTN